MFVWPRHARPRCADAERKSSEGSMRSGVRVAANDRHSRLSVAKLGADDVDDPLLVVVQVVKSNSELLAIGAERIDLLPRDRVGDRQPTIGGRNVVIRSCNRALWPPSFPLSQPQAFECLCTSHFMDQVKIDIEDRLLAGSL